MRLFLSYGHDEHIGFALRLKADLEQRGHAVWFDAERLKPGADWERYIEEGLDLTSAEHGKVLLLLTPHSVRRPGGYCLNELARACSRGLTVIPLMVSTVEPPLSIAAIQWLDFRDCLPPEEHDVKYAARFLAPLAFRPTQNASFALSTTGIGSAAASAAVEGAERGHPRGRSERH